MRKVTTISKLLFDQAFLPNSATVLKELHKCQLDTDYEPISLTNSFKQLFIDKFIVVDLVKKCPRLYGKRKVMRFTSVSASTLFLTHFSKLNIRSSIKNCSSGGCPSADNVVCRGLFIFKTKKKVSLNHTS